MVGSISSTAPASMTSSPNLTPVGEEEVQIETDHNADFFNPNSKANVQLRDRLAIDTLDELLHYLNVDGGKVAIFDATNSTVKRRELLLSHVESHYEALNQSKGSHHDYNVLFLETICTQQELINKNIALKLNGPDYINVQDKNLALVDFKKRLENYEKCYETVTESECEASVSYQFIKIVNVLSIESFNISGFLPVILFNLLKNFNLANKKIWLTSHAINDISEISLNLPSEFSSSLQIYSNHFSNKHNLKNFHKISADLDLDNIHDLILEFEGCHYDNILIQTSNDLFINGLLKYFLTNKQLLDTNHIDFETEIICINPKLYSVGFEKFEIPESFDEMKKTNIDGFSSATSIPSLTMTRTNSNNSHLEQSIQTPIYNELWQKFNYKNLNVLELSKKLEML